jgi:hypothetical protein
MDRAGEGGGVDSILLIGALGPGGPKNVQGEGEAREDPRGSREGPRGLRKYPRGAWDGPGRAPGGPQKKKETVRKEKEEIKEERKKERKKGGQPAAIFYPLGHPTPCSASQRRRFFVAFSIRPQTRFAFSCILCSASWQLSDPGPWCVSGAYLAHERQNRMAFGQHVYGFIPGVDMWGGHLNVFTTKPKM